MNETTPEKNCNTTGHNSTRRAVIVNIFIGLFIIMCYFYLSELYGSISTIFIKSNEFLITFSISLLIFTFLVILAGPIHGFITGFFGELLYQISFYSSFNLYWIIIVALYGLMCGYIRYKPLKYQNFKYILKTIFILIILAVITSILIIFSLLIQNQGSYSLETIIINYGINFFIQALISAVFLVPLLLYLYDKLLATQERHIYQMFLTHHPLSACDHTFYLEFGRTKIYFCSRCSGLILGTIISIFFTHLLDLIFNFIITPEIALILIICVPIPGLIDWGTQRLQLRKSTTTSRIFTGFIIGIGLHLIAFTRKFYFLTIIIISLYFTILFILMFLGYKKQMKLFREEINSFTEENEYNIIFIHGLESSGKGFKAQHLKEIFPNILTPDFKAYVPTSSLKALLFTRMNQLMSILEQKKNWIIIGSSFGGLMGTLYTLQYPEKVERLILLAPYLNSEEFNFNDFQSVYVPVIAYHGNKDTVVPSNISKRIAEKLFYNLEYNIVDDDHLLHSTVINMDWKRVLQVF